MKKILLTVLAAISFAVSSNAQLAEGSVFPDFHLTSITGQPIHLYGLLDSGYTVFIDVSATWCPPCWSYHNGHHLDSLYQQHGPSTWSGVNPGTTNNVAVLFVQGEATSKLAELYGDTAHGAILFTTTELPYSNVTQGNWVTGTPYPIVDDTTSSDPAVGTAALDAAWHIAYFPTIYMICRDHLVHVMQQPTAVAAYAASQSTCPNYAASTTVDAKAVPYQGNSYFVCTANPSVTFQNYSATTTLTSATINIKDATGTTVATQPWTGSLAPFAVANVPITAFAGTTFGGYKFSVSVTGDSHPANDASTDSLFKVYTAGNALNVPATENFSGNFPYKEDISGGYAFPASASSLIGPNGSVDTVMVFDFFQQTSGVDEYVFGNFNTAGISGLKLDFDISDAQYASTDNDALALKVSTDCGATWSTAWSASGTSLATTAPVTTEFIPSAAAQWKHYSVNMSTYMNANTVIKFVATSAYGNNAYLDNLRLYTTAGVPQITTAGEITVSPNPAKEFANVNISLTEETTVNVQVYDAMGRTLNTINEKLAAGDQKIELSTAAMPSGIYTVKISAGTTVTTKQLSVIK